MWSPTVGQNDLLQQARDLFFSGWEEDCGAEDLYDLLEDVDVGDDPLLLAYRGAATSTMAGCAFLPTGKLRYFLNGKSEIEQAVDLDPWNAEIRFLRYSVQTNIPHFLDYDDTEEDKEIIINALKEMNVTENNDLRRHILEYMMETADRLNDDDREILSKLLDQKDE